MENLFKRVHSAQDIAISSLLIISGILLVFLPNSVSINILGFTLIFVGLVLAVVMKTSYCDLETGEKFRKSEKFFPACKMDSILKALETAPVNVDTSDEGKGSGLRLLVYYNKKSGRSMAQLYEYVPYKYEPCSPIYIYDRDKIVGKQ